MDQGAISRRKRKARKLLVLPEELSILCLDKKLWEDGAQRERETGGASRHLTAKCSLEKLPGGPETSSQQGADPSQGNAKKTDGFVIQHRRQCSLTQN